jgi:hypothetical protein
MRIMAIPDTQCKPGTPTAHLGWAGEYAVDTRPDVIVFIGDHWDMPSLSSYDKGKKSFEGRRYTHDIVAGNDAMDEFMSPITREQDRLKRNKERLWKPRMVFCLGNHEYRITRATEDSAELDGLISYDHFNLADYGFEVYPFLQVVEIEGVLFSHYFTSGVMGRPVSSARLMLQKKMMSCFMGHVQDRDVAFARKGDGNSVTGIFGGIYYMHDEDYLNAQTNGSWTGIWMLNDVRNGSFDEMPVSLNYLGKRYG